MKNKDRDREKSSPYAQALSYGLVIWAFLFENEKNKVIQN